MLFVSAFAVTYLKRLPVFIFFVCFMINGLNLEGNHMIPEEITSSIALLIITVYSEKLRFHQKLVIRLNFITLNFKQKV